MLSTLSTRLHRVLNPLYRRMCRRVITCRCVDAWVKYMFALGNSVYTACHTACRPVDTHICKTGNADSVIRVAIKRLTAICGAVL